jgi:hypothetical protein
MSNHGPSMICRVHRWAKSGGRGLSGHGRMVIIIVLRRSAYFRQVLRNRFKIEPDLVKAENATFSALTAIIHANQVGSMSKTLQ